MDNYQEEYIDYEDSISTRREGKRSKRKNHKINSMGLRNTQRIILEKAKNA